MKLYPTDTYWELAEKFPKLEAKSGFNADALCGNIQCLRIKRHTAEVFTSISSKRLKGGRYYLAVQTKGGTHPPSFYIKRLVGGSLKEMTEVGRFLEKEKNLRFYEEAF